MRAFASFLSLERSCEDELEGELRGRAKEEGGGGRETHNELASPLLREEVRGEKL